MPTNEDEDLKTAPEGIFAKASDGQYFFIPNSDIKRLTVPTDAVKVAEKIFSANGVTTEGSAQPALSSYCRMLWTYLSTHDPNNETWRRVSLKWISFC
jgi:hypothetical protein